jgi:hypothetical protein
MIFFCLGNKKRCFIETPSSPSKLLDNPYIHRELPPGSLSPGRPGRGGGGFLGQSRTEAQQGGQAVGLQRAGFSV